MRLDLTRAAPEAHEALLALERAIRQFALDPRLLELVRIRSSQINACARCLQNHTRAALARGETPGRIFQLPAWEDSPHFSARERAALRWTEAVTRVRDGHVPAEVYRAAREQFTEAELVELTVVIGSINMWNRLNIAFRTHVDPE